MGDNEAVVAIFTVFAIFVMPVGMFFHYLKVRERARAQAGNPAQMAALVETAQRMEQRIETLESLLDADVPGWRNRSSVR
jgi:phage shock protein B